MIFCLFFIMNVNLKTKIILFLYINEIVDEYQCIFSLYRYYLCYSGTMIITVENDTVTLNAGDVIIFDKHVPHSVAPTSANDLGVNIVLNENYFSKNYKSSS